MNNETLVKKEMQAIGIFAMIAAYYSRILEQTVTVRQAKALVNAQCAFVALILPCELGIVYHALAFVWFLAAVLQCKERMNGREG